MKKGLLFLSIILLAVCSFDLHIGYWIYQILRWVVTITAIVFAFGFYKNCQWKFVLCCIIAVLFNPIAPIYLKKSVWAYVDIITAGLFLIIGFYKKNIKS